MPRFVLETAIAAPPRVVFDALVLGRYLRRLIAERNDAVAAAIEGRGRTLPA